MQGARNKEKLLEEGHHTGEKTLKELDREFQKRKDKLSLVEDIKVMVAVLLIFLLAVTIVGVKSVIMQVDGGNFSTFKPLTQQKVSNMGRTGLGFIPCNG